MNVPQRATAAIVIASLVGVVWVAASFGVVPAVVALGTGSLVAVTGVLCYEQAHHGPAATEAVEPACDVVVVPAPVLSLTDLGTSRPRAKLAHRHHRRQPHE